MSESYANPRESTWTITVLGVLLANIFFATIAEGTGVIGMEPLAVALVVLFATVIIGNEGWSSKTPEKARKKQALFIALNLVLLGAGTFFKIF